MISEKLMEMDRDDRFRWILEHPDDQQLLRKEYLALDDQGRADLLYRLRGKDGKALFFKREQIYRMFGIREGK